MRGPHALGRGPFEGDEKLVRRVKTDFEHAAISDKLKALFVIAAKVQKGGKNVLVTYVVRARDQGPRT